MEMRHMNNREFGRALDRHMERELDEYLTEEQASVIVDWAAVHKCGELCPVCGEPDCEDANG
jgi:hypothetical protein